MSILFSCKKNIIQYLNLILLFILVIFDIYFCYSEVLQNVSANSYMIRDIIRTNDIFNWQPPLIGSDTTPGSYSWGPFFYFISSVLGFFTKINLLSFSEYTIIFRFISLFIILIYINKYFKNSSFFCSGIAFENGPYISILCNLDPWNRSNSLEFKTFRSPLIFSLKTNQKCNSLLEISMHVQNITIQTASSTNTIHNKKLQFTYLGEY